MESWHYMSFFGILCSTYFSKLEQTNINRFFTGWIAVLVGKRVTYGMRLEKDDFSRFSVGWVFPSAHCFKFVDRIVLFLQW